MIRTPGPDQLPQIGALTPDSLLPRRHPGLIKRIARAIFTADPRTGPQPELRDTTQSGVAAESVRSIYDRYFQYDVTRKAIYTDVEDMDQSSDECSVALDTITTTITTSEDGVQMSIQTLSEDARVQAVLDQVNLRSNIHQKLPMIVRNLVKYGDFFGEIIANRAGEVVDLKPLPPITMFRNQDPAGNLLLGEPRFDKDGRCENIPRECAFEQRAMDTSQIMAAFWPWQIMHVRLNHDGFTPYGRSHLRVARVTYKKLKAAEEALIIGRMTRALLKLIFKVDTTGMSRDQKMNALREFQSAVTQRRHVDGARENPFSVMTDFYLSTGYITVNGQPQPQLSTVEALDPKNSGLQEIADIEYMHRKLLMDLRVPPAHMGWEKDVNAKATLCLTGDTGISLLDGRELPIIDLVKEWEAGAEPWVYSVDPTSLAYKPGRVIWAGKTGEREAVWNVTLDNGECFKATATHPLMMSDGSYRPVSDIVAGDSLMPLYRRVSSEVEGDQIDGYEMLRTADGSWRYTHRLMKPPTLKLKVRHHKNFNKRDNRPVNLELMTWADHKAYHQEIARDPANVAKMTAASRTPEGRASRGEQMRRQHAEGNLDAGRAANLLLARAANPYDHWVDREENPRFRRDATLEALVESAKRSNSLKELVRISGYSECLVRRVLSEAGRDYHWLADTYMAGRVRAASTRNYAERPSWNKGLTKADAPQMSRSGRRVSVNHSVVSVEFAGWEPVYDLTVEHWNNFALSAGVVVHNTIQDVQFVRWCRTIQQLVGHGLEQFYDTALVLAGIDPTSVEYEIQWPSLKATDSMSASQADLWWAQADQLNSQIGAIDAQWVMQHRLDMSQEEIAEQLARVEAERAATAAREQAAAEATAQAGQSPQAVSGTSKPNSESSPASARTSAQQSNSDRSTRHQKGDDSIPSMPKLPNSNNGYGNGASNGKRAIRQEDLELLPYLVSQRLDGLLAMEVASDADHLLMAVHEQAPPTPAPTPEMHVHFAEGSFLAKTEIAVPPSEAPQVHVNLEPAPVTVNVEPTPFEVHVPEQQAPDVNVRVAAPRVEVTNQVATPEVTVNVPPADVKVDVKMPDPPKRVRGVRLVYDADGNPTGAISAEEDDN